MLARQVECVTQPACCDPVVTAGTARMRVLTARVVNAFGCRRLAIGDLAIGYSRSHPTAALIGAAITFAGVSGSMANHFTAAAGFTSSR